MKPVPPADWSARSQALAELLARVRLGDRAAFEALYRQTAPHLFAIVLRIQGQRSQAEDILQDVFVNIWRAAHTFDAERSQPLTWLGSIARHRAIDSLRREQARLPTVSLSPDPDDPAAGDDGLDQLPGPQPGPLEQLIQRGEADGLQHCLARLPASQRQSLHLAFVQGLSHAEIAQHLGQPLGTVKSWVRRGLLSLRGCLEPRSPAAAPHPED